MKKLMALLMAAAVMMLSTGCGSGEQENVQTAAKSLMSVGRSDFEITLKVPKTHLKVGESMTVTARLYNNSGMRLKIGNMNDQIDIGAFRKNEEEKTSFSFLFAVSGYIEKDSHSTKTYVYTAEKAGKYVMKATGKISLILYETSDGDNKKNISIDSKKIPITVTK